MARWALLFAWALGPTRALLSRGPLDRTNRNYDENLAAKMVLYSDAAYCGDISSQKDDTVGNWTCPPCQLASRLRAGLHSVRSFENHSYMAYGYSGLSRDNSSIVLAFRGSVTHQNIRTCREYRLVPMMQGRGLVHAGMYQHQLSTQPTVTEHVDALLSLQPRPRRILVTGHSLGSASAFLTGLQLAEEHPELQVVVYGFAFGSMGDVDLQQRVEHTPNLLVWTVSNAGDTAPICGVFVAPCTHRRKGYHDMGNRVWYPGKYGRARGPEWIECKSNWTECMTVPTEHLNWHDHDWYLGHSMYCCDLDSHDPLGPQPHDSSGKGCQPPFDFRFRTFANTFLNEGSRQLHWSEASELEESEKEIRNAMAAGRSAAA